MDIFQTIVTGCGIIYTFLDSYTSASQDSLSLAARLRWDLRVVGQFTEYYETRIQTNNSGLSAHDAEILEHSAAYLGGLAAKITVIAERIQSKNRFRKELNKALWWHREEEVRQLEGELFEWTTRLDIRLVGLPTELKTVIKLDDAVGSASPNLRASIQIQSLKAVTERAAQVPDKDIFRTQVDKVFQDAEVTTLGRFRAVENEGAQFLLERRFHEHRPGSASWLELKTGLIRLASALHCLDGTSVSLLKCSYLYDAQDPLNPRFCLVNCVPFRTYNEPECPTLKSLITKTQGKVRLPAAHSLSQRFAVARSLATAVFFLHSVRFLHHAVSSHNILMLQRSRGTPSQRFPHYLGVPFLVGFGAVKEFHAISDGRTHPDPDLLYQHPDRLLLQDRPKYAPAHDIYSLGMVLLELAIWKPLERYSQELLVAEKRSARIADLLGLTDISMGARFRKVTEWCLSLDSSAQIDPLRISQELLEPLEEMASALT